jgi:hypothetical protein
MMSKRTMTKQREPQQTVAAAAGVIAAVKQAAAVPELPIVMPFIFSKTRGVISDPCPGAKLDTTAEFYPNFAATYDRWWPDW